MKCGRCLTCRYCSKECQKKQWKKHKECCNTWKYIAEAKEMGVWRVSCIEFAPICYASIALDDVCVLIYLPTL